MRGQRQRVESGSSCSKPSTVVDRGTAMTPALLIKISRPSGWALSHESAKERTESKEARSRVPNSTEPGVRTRHDHGLATQIGDIGSVHRVCH